MCWRRASWASPPAVRREYRRRLVSGLHRQSVSGRGARGNICGRDFVGHAPIPITLLLMGGKESQSIEAGPRMSAARGKMPIGLADGLTFEAYRPPYIFQTRRATAVQPVARALSPTLDSTEEARTRPRRRHGLFSPSHDGNKMFCGPMGLPTPSRVLLTRQYHHLPVSSGKYRKY